MTPPDQRHLHLLEGVTFRPVFIMGNARSGTTVLYQLLDRADRFNCVTAYHLVRYDEILTHHLAGTTERAKLDLAQRFRELAVGDSRFDRVAVSPDFPEEYGFALTAGHFMQLSPRTLPRFLELCRKVQRVSRPERPLLLKNPWDCRNFLYIKAVLPDSRFIFIHRDPVRVMDSLLRGVQALLAARNAYHALLARFYDRLMERRVRRAAVRLLFSPRLGLGARIVGWQVARTARYFLDHVGRLPAGDYLSVRYEDLCRAPEEVVHCILDFLGLPGNHEVDYRAMVRPTETPLSGQLAERGTLMRRLKLEPYLAYCGYEGAGGS